MDDSRPHFTVRRLLLATLCLAIGLGSFSALVRGGPLVAGLGWPLVLGALESPFVPIAVLAGETHQATVVAALASAPLLLTFMWSVT